MRRLLVLAVLLFAVLAVRSAVAAPLFLVEGRGWGHGIGMPQYGAHGYALKESRSYAWILSHYYPGTTLGQAPVNAVRVLLADNRRSLTVGSNAAFTATDADGKSYQLPAGSIQLGPSLKVAVGGAVQTLASPVRFSPGARSLKLGARAYRGDLVVRTSGGRLAAINHVGLEDYLYGVVPDEMPPSWAMEALKAQAVAARSYALASRRSGGIFDLFADTRSQVYGGVASEESRTNAAVAATAGQVVLHDGQVAHTFFHSTSGGRTAAIQDVWTGAQPRPYLVSVPDPYDTLSPYHRWGPLPYTGRRLAARLGAAAPAGRLLDVRVARNRSQRADSVLARGSRGDSRLSGARFQSRLRLRSSWFAVGVLSLGGAPRLAYGDKTMLRGIARGVGAASLERRLWGRRWERVSALRRAPDGSFRTLANPTITTWYRISSSKGRGLPHRVAVAALVRFSAIRSANALTGLVRPAVAGAAVTIQRLRRERWVTVATTRTNGAGSFRARLALVRGSYRALARVGAGYVQGKTPVLVVGTG